MIYGELSTITIEPMCLGWMKCGNHLLDWSNLAMVCQSLRMVKFGFAYLLQHGWAWMSYWEIKTICSRLYIYTYLCVSILASICFFQKITPISYKILQMRLLFPNPCRDAIVTSYVDAHWLKKGRGRPLLDEG